MNLKTEMNLAEVDGFMEDPAAVVTALQSLISSLADVPKLTSSVLALWTMSTYFDAEDSNLQISSMIEAVPEGQREGLIQLLSLIAKRPVPGSGVHAVSDRSVPGARLN